MKVTQAQAEAALAAVKEQFKSYMEVLVFPAEDGLPELVIEPLCPEPVLVMDWEGWTGGAPTPAILWEDGPSEWAYRATGGGSSEEDRVLMAQANEEFHSDLKVKEDDPVTWPSGVHAEPYTSFILTLQEA